eukprot:Awhi_evm1s13141
MQLLWIEWVTGDKEDEFSISPYRKAALDKEVGEFRKRLQQGKFNRQTKNENCQQTPDGTAS